MREYVNKMLVFLSLTFFSFGMMYVLLFGWSWEYCGIKENALFQNGILSSILGILFALLIKKQTGAQIADQMENKRKKGLLVRLGNNPN